MYCFSRAPRWALIALSLTGLSLPALAQQAETPTPAPVQARAPKGADTPWLYVGSDLTRDGNWKFGVLPNGLRYAVRKNGVPPGQVAVRVRIDAGSLMEKDSERGFAHLLEHLSFRGSTYVPDGESKRIWQRLGVTFGSDSNASTTFTETVYKLDLPDGCERGGIAARQAPPGANQCDGTSLDESMKILAGMMSNPTMSQTALDAERPVVMSEAREQPGPQVRWKDALFDMMFAGQPIAQRDPIGTTETLSGATPESVQAFHARWYRPERAIVVVVGDADTASLEKMVVKHFSDWKGVGPAPKTPPFGSPEPGHPESQTLVEPAIPAMTMLTVVRPWTVFADTVIFNQKRLVDLVAIRLINRRLESRARSGASYLAAQAGLDDIARSANVTTVQVMPIGEDWEAALRETRSVIAQVQSTQPTQAEIDRELAEVDAAMKNRIATAPVESGVSLADLMTEAVDINETVTTPEASYAIFREAVDAGMFNPKAVQEASKRVFDGVATRALVNLHAPDAQAAVKVAAALKADVTVDPRKRKALADVGFDKLPKLGKPGKVVSRETVVAQPKIEKIVFSNGVSLLLHSNSSEVGKVYVNVRFGHGMNALPADRDSAAWAGEAALVASGVAQYGQEELDALMGPRQMGFQFDIEGDAFTLAAQTNKQDLSDQLKLFATKLASPGWDPRPLARAKAGVLASYAGLSASPDAVLNRDLDSLLHSGDPRWGVPSQEVVKATTPESFRKLWEPLLQSGPIEVAVFGDMDSEATIKAVAATFGALKPRPANDNAAAPAIRFPAHDPQPVVRTHEGQPDQAAAAIAWPTGGGSGGIAESRKLEILAAVFRDRLLDQLRSQAGVSYSPNIISEWPLGQSSGGKLLALGLVPPDKTDFFFKLARGIAADLVKAQIGDDELDRALTPLKQAIIRRSSGNMFWMQLVEGGSYDPARIAAVDSLAGDLANTTPEEVHALAVKYLRPDKDWTMVVVPDKKVLAAAAAATPSSTAPAAPGR